jgi:hypothetical protein
MKSVVAYQVGRGSNDIQRLAVDMGNFTAQEIRQTLRDVSFSYIQGQVEIGNPPSEVVVDGTATKSIGDANKVIFARFGNKFDRKIVTQIERNLRRQIRNSGLYDTGRLADVRRNWTWLLIDKNGTARNINPRTLQTLERGQKLVLVPRGVVNDELEHYATAANSKYATKSRKGYLAKTTKALNRNTQFKQFYVARAGFTSRYALPGEVARAGKGGKRISAFISITPRIKFNRSEVKRYLR